MKKRKYLIGIGLLITLLSVVGISYAYWMYTTHQTDRNVVTSKCFEVTMLKEGKGITLEDAHPVTDEEGKKQEGYTFTIKNICNTLAYYQVNLEELVLNTQIKRLDGKYIKVSLNDSKGKILSEYTEVDPTLKEEDTDVEEKIISDKSHKLTSDSLEPNEEKEYTLKLWMADSTPAIDEVMNATFESKVSVIASYKEESELDNTIIVTSQSENEEYSKEKEIIDVTGRSENYNIIEYSLDNERWNSVEEEKEVTVKETFETEGTYSFYFKDEVGNIEEKDIETNKLDQTAPEINIEETSDENGAVVNITFNDPKSGLQAYKIEDDISTIDVENGWTEITNDSPTITYKSTENKTIYITVKDNLENESTKDYTITKADIKGPDITIENPKENEWTNESVTITITATDDKSEIDKFYYKKQNEEEWKEIESPTIDGKNGTASITFSETEETTYEFKVTDKSNNTSEIKTSIIKIDKNPPSQSFSISPESPNGSDNWYNTTPTVTITGSDTGGSNIVSGKYCTGTEDCEPSTEFNETSTTVTLTDGTGMRVCATFKDNAGNESEATCSYSYNIDTEKPSQTITLGENTPGTANSGWYKKAIIHVTLNDTRSGVSSAKYCISKNGAICDPNTQASVTNNAFNVELGTDANSQKVCVNVTDNAGITSETSCSGAYNVDNSLPTAAIKTVTESATSITIDATTSSDSGSQITLYTFKAEGGGTVKTGTSATGTYTFSSLNRLTSYTITVTVQDKAGNLSTNNASKASYTTDTAISALQNMPKVTSGVGLYQVTHSGMSNAQFNNTELRYAGKDPSNYVTFNGEAAGWRIIGLVNTPNGQRIKLIRKAHYSTSIQWDKSTNDWSNSSLQTELNTTYYGKMTSGAKNMIDENVTWNLGGSSTYNDVTTATFYTRERGTTVYSENPTTWTGKIGLMYPSDYGWATSGGSTTNRAACLNKELYNWDNSSVSDCKNNDWLYDSSYFQWTLTPRSSYSFYVFRVRAGGGVSDDYWDETYAVRPVVYLKITVKISGGSGTASSPYTLSL